VLLRWNVQLGNSVIFRSSKPDRIASNLDIFDFELAGEHMDTINGLNDGTRLRPDPDTYDGS
jgi:2,5-diketo-D-gluconate reductase A